MAQPVRFLVGLHVQFGVQRLVAAGRRVVDQRTDRDADLGVGPAAGRVFEPGATRRFSGRALLEALAVVGSEAGHPPNRQFRAAQRDQLRYFGHREAQAVVVRGPDGNRNRDRDAEGRNDQREARGLVGLGHHVEDRRRPEEEFFVAFVVRPDRYQPRLRVDRAFLEGVVRRGAPGQRVGVAEHALRGVEDDVLGRLRLARGGERERRRQVRVPSGLRAGARGREGFDADRSLSRRGKGRYRQGREEECGRAPAGHLPPPPPAPAARL